MGEEIVMQTDNHGKGTYQQVLLKNAHLYMANSTSTSGSGSKEIQKGNACMGAGMMMLHVHG